MFQRLLQRIWQHTLSYHQKQFSIASAYFFWWKVFTIYQAYFLLHARRPSCTLGFKRPGIYPFNREALPVMKEYYAKKAADLAQTHTPPRHNSIDPNYTHHRHAPPPTGNGYSAVRGHHSVDGEGRNGADSCWISRRITPEE